MTVLALILAIIAAVLFVIAAMFDRDGLTNARGRVVALVPLGLAFLTVALICQFCGIGGEPVGA